MVNWYIPTDLMGAYRDENHSAIGWDKKGKVVFTFCRRGNSLDCHFAADKKALRHIREAITDFIAWVRQYIPWCKMLIAAVNRNSVEKIISDIKFMHVTDNQNLRVYARYI